MSELALDYGNLQHLLEQVDVDVDAAEWHGSLCGLLCADANADERPWLDLVFGGDAVTLESDAREIFYGFFRRAFELLNDPGLDFNLLLPDDDVELFERVDALGQWCAGFIYGLGVGGIEDFAGLSSDCADMLQSLLEIARVSFDEGSATEADEASYMELSEYVRVGVIWVNDELKPAGHVRKALH